MLYCRGFIFHINSVSCSSVFIQETWNGSGWVHPNSLCCSSCSVISLNSCLWLLLCLLITGLDYETQKSYSLTFESRDGGGRVSTANLFLEVEDVNDNAPVFEQKEYSRTVREGASSFQPQLFVRVRMHFSDVTHLLMHCGICLVSSILANHKIHICIILFFKAKSFCQLYKHLYV